MKNKERFETESEDIDIEKITSDVEEINSRPENIRIDPNNFKDIFAEAIINKDLGKVREKNERINSQKGNITEEQRNANIIAEFVEVAIPNAIRKLGWLGNKIKVIRPSLYDDYFKGIDNVVQMLPEEIIDNEKDIKCIGFSIDFTISEEESMKKIFDVALSIAKGKTPEIKYFSTDVITKEGPKTIKIGYFKIPKVIMSCPNKILRKSQKDLSNFEDNPDNDETRKIAKETILKYHFIRESLIQLELFSDLSQRLGNEDAYNVYNNSLESFKTIMKEQGIDKKLLNKKLEGIPGLASTFDLDAQDGRLIKMLVELSKQI